MHGFLLEKNIRLVKGVHKMKINGAVEFRLLVGDLCCGVENSALHPSPMLCSYSLFQSTIMNHNSIT